MRKSQPANRTAFRTPGPIRGLNPLRRGLRRFRQVAAFFCTLAAWAMAGQQTRAAENPYDLVAKTVAPFVGPFLETPDPGAFRLVLLLEEPGGLRRLVLSIEAPDRLRLDTILGAERVTLCRDGDTVWAWPAATFRPLLARGEVQAQGEPPRALGKLRLPVNDAAAAFLPALLAVKDLGEQTVVDTRTRLLEVRLAPELAKKTGEAVARLWIDPARHQLVRAEVRIPSWAGAARFESFYQGDALPGDTWVPGLGQEGEVVRLTAVEFLRIANSLVSRARKTE